MKARSAEYLGEADRFPAARAALSEADREARTHHGTWVLFDPLFVSQGVIEARLRDAARNAEELRYDSDYRLGGATQEEAKRVMADAEELVAVVRMRFS